MSNRFGPRTRQTGLVVTALVKNWMGRAYGFIQSVQRNTITITDVATTNTRAITAVDTTRSIVSWLGFDCTAAVGTQAENNFGVALTNATTVTGTRGAGGAGASTVVGGFEVVQYAPGVIKRIQVGTVTIANGAATGTAVIASVTIGKAQIVNNGRTWNNAVLAPESTEAVMSINSATQVLATRTGIVGDWTGYFTIVEFN